MVQKIITFNVALKSTERQWVQKIPEVYTNDLGSVSIKFNITDCTDTELTGSSAIVLLKMRDGSFFQGPSVDVERTLNVFSYTLKENEGNHDGLAEIQLIVSIAGKEFATQKYQFKVNSGLDSEVAREIMIYDWTTLTAEARAYIDQFTADEMVRDAEFDNNEFDRNTAFVASQDARTLAFGTEQTNRGTAFTAEQTNRGTAFTAEQNERTTEFNESESDRTVAESGRVTAEANRVTAESGRVAAESGRVAKENQRVTAESSRVTAESGRVTAESGRATAESGRVTAETNRAAAFTAFDTRLTAEETATAANKISAVKSKTFADVGARFEDVEADTTAMGTNLFLNGDFSNGTTGWILTNSTLSASNNVLSVIADGTGASPRVNQILTGASGKKVYMRARVRVTNSNCTSIYLRTGDGMVQAIQTLPVLNTWYNLTVVGNFLTNSIRIDHNYVDSTTANGKVMEVQYVFAIDLTATFGAGNEPTVEQMDAILAKFPNSWFDGTKNLFQAKASLNKLMAVDARTEFEARNLVVNGDFSNGASGWNAIDAVVSGRASKVATDKYMGFTQSVITTVGSKYYVSAMVEGDPLVYLKFGSGTDTRPTSPANQKLSLITTATSVNTELRLADGRDSGWTAYYGDNFCVIDLTKTFGAGKEPTLAEMDRLMARFPNSWFDGTKPIQTIETLYQEKANKVQEAWITPTLLNGWTSVVSASAFPVSYMKDEFGRVHLRGKATGGTGALMFVLPATYRPVRYSVHPVTNGSTSAAAVTIDNGWIASAGNVKLSTLSGMASVHLDGISFTLI